MRPRRLTMADVATEAHVSIKTVSRVLHDDPLVAPATQQRVRSVIDRLGFERRSSWTSALDRNATYTIGLVVEDLSNPFYSQIAAGVEREALARGYLLISTSAEGSPTREERVLETLARQVDGLVVIPAATSAAAADPSHDHVPVVHVDRPVTNSSADVVVGDNEGGIVSAVEHLVAYGHRRIAFLGDDPSFWTARQRRESFRATHQRLSLPGRPEVSMGPHDLSSLRAALTAWAGQRDPVTAVITGNNRVTLLMLRTARDLGLEMALVAYDDFELAELLDPPVTVVHQDPQALGQRAAQELFARIGGDTSPPKHVVLPSRLVVRESGRPTPITSMS